MPLDLHDQRWLIEQFNEIRDMIGIVKEANAKAISEAVQPIHEAIHGNGRVGLKASIAQHDAYFKIIGTCLVVIGGGVLKVLLG